MVRYSFLNSLKEKRNFQDEGEKSAKYWLLTLQTDFWLYLYMPALFLIKDWRYGQLIGLDSWHLRVERYQCQEVSTPKSDQEFGCAKYF